MSPARSVVPQPGTIAVRRVAALPDASTTSRPSACSLGHLPRPGSIAVSRVASVPRPGSIAVPTIGHLPQAGSLPSERVITRRSQGSIDVERVRTTLPAARSHALESGAGDLADTRLGRVTVNDRVVVKIARRAAADHPDAGAVAAQVFGTAVPGLSKIGGRATSLDSLPKASVTVDGTTVFIDVELSIRYPAPLADTTEAVRSHVRDQVHVLTGLDVAEVNISVGALVADLPARARVR